MFQYMRVAVTLAIIVIPTMADYACVCSYEDTQAVYSKPSKNEPSIGHMDATDCKPAALETGQSDIYYSIQFEKQLGYIAQTPQTKATNCLGNPSVDDLMNIAESHERYSNADYEKRFLVQVATSWNQATLVHSFLKYLGIGYNVLLGNPAAYFGDPGYKLSQRIFQISQTGHEIQYIENTNCSRQSKTKIVLSEQAYQQQLLDRLHLQNTPAQLQVDAFKLNSEFVKDVEMVGHDKSVVYKDTVVTCEYGHGRFLTNDNNVHVTHDFALSVCSLNPQPADLQEYFRFIDRWGTNIVIDVQVGTYMMQRDQARLFDIFTAVQKDKPGIIQQNNGQLTLDLDTLALYSANNTDLARLWSNVSTTNHGTKNIPLPLRTIMIPLNESLDYKYWGKVLPLLESEEVCFGFDNVRGDIQAKLADALSQYSDYRRIKAGSTFPIFTDNRTIAILSVWPKGKYTLMQAASGCPGNPSDWEKGTIYQDTEDDGAKSHWSNNISSVLAGSFYESHITTKYCTKVHNDNTMAFDWPRGEYCIMPYSGVCPSGFKNGSIIWDDEDDSNHNYHSGTVPANFYSWSRTEILYCCRYDGSPDTPILLPTDRPFVLNRFRTKCQNVSGMRVDTASVFWDDEDSTHLGTVTGSHPYDTGGVNNHELYFCHYSSI